MTLVLLVAGAAHACLIDVPGPFDLDATSDDTVAPDAPGTPIAFRIKRGVGAVCHGDGVMSASSCDDLGSIALAFPPALDDRSPPEDETTDVQVGVGYSLRVVLGAVPDDFWLYDTPQGAFLADDGTANIPLAWVDGDENLQEAFDFQLGITAVDLAGNESREVIVGLSDPGAEDTSEPCDADPEPLSPVICSCSSAPPAPLLLLAALLGVRRARTPSRPPNPLRVS